MYQSEATAKYYGLISATDLLYIIFMFCPNKKYVILILQVLYLIQLMLFVIAHVQPISKSYIMFFLSSQC